MKVVAHGSRRSVAPAADTYDYVTWTVVGPFTVGLRASRIAHIDDWNEESAGARVADLGELLGAPPSSGEGPYRVVEVVANPPYALRIPGRVTLTGPTPDALLDLPDFLADLRMMPGIEALSVQGDRFAFVLDLDRLGERVPETHSLPPSPSLPSPKRST